MNDLQSYIINLETLAKLASKNKRMKGKSADIRKRAYLNEKTRMRSSLSKKDKGSHFRCGQLLNKCGETVRKLVRELDRRRNARYSASITKSGGPTNAGR